MSYHARDEASIHRLHLPFSSSLPALSEVSGSMSRMITFIRLYKVGSAKNHVLTPKLMVDVAKYKRRGPVIEV